MRDLNLCYGQRGKDDGGIDRQREKFGTQGVIEMATNFHMVMNAALVQQHSDHVRHPQHCCQNVMYSSQTQKNIIFLKENDNLIFT
jgi:hypothetical protein